MGGKSCRVAAMVELVGGRSFWLAMAFFWILFLVPVYLFICLSVLQFSLHTVLSTDGSRTRTTIVKNAKTRVNITGQNKEGEGGIKTSRSQEIIMYVCC